MESGGTKPIQDLRVGERVLAYSERDRQLVYSEVLAFLDHDLGTQKHFYIIGTEAGATLPLTAAHLLFVAEEDCSGGELGGAMRAVFASDVHPGQCVFVATEGQVHGHLMRIIWVRLQEKTGVFAPVTQHGTLVVNGILASCYAIVDQHHLAHWSFGPLRLLYRWFGPVSHPANGLHWYSKLLYWIGTLILDSKHFHPSSLAHFQLEERNRNRERNRHRGNR